MIESLDVMEHEGRPGAIRAFQNAAVTRYGTDEADQRFRSEMWERAGELQQAERDPAGAADSYRRAGESAERTGAEDDLVRAAGLFERESNALALTYSGERQADALVSAAEARARFPAFAAVDFPQAPNRLFVTDYGAGIESGRFTLEPPVEDPTREYAVSIPQVDADGNDVAGVRVPHLRVPLATHTGWNYRSAGSTRARYSIVGSFLPFAATRAERERKGDPRPAIEERYPSRADYVARIAVAAHALSEERLLLAEDVERYVARAIEGDELK